VNPPLHKDLVDADAQPVRVIAGSGAQDTSAGDDNDLVFAVLVGIERHADPDRAVPRVASPMMPDRATDMRRAGAETGLKPCRTFLVRRLSC
jgi:hypothetical protein